MKETKKSKKFKSNLTKREITTKDESLKLNKKQRYLILLIVLSKIISLLRMLSREEANLFLNMKRTELNGT